MAPFIQNPFYIWDESLNVLYGLCCALLLWDLMYFAPLLGLFSCCFDFIPWTLQPIEHSKLAASMLPHSRPLCNTKGLFLFDVLHTLNREFQYSFRFRRTPVKGRTCQRRPERLNWVDSWQIEEGAAPSCLSDCSKPSPAARCCCPSADFLPT